jgi:hypothetical protein
MLRFFRRKSGPPAASDVASRAFIFKSLIAAGMAVPPPEMYEAMSTWLTTEDKPSFRTI